MNGLWIMIIVVSAMGIFAGMYEKKLAYKRRTREDSDELQEVLARLERIEERMANLETIVLEREKVREFDRAL